MRLLNVNDEDDDGGGDDAVDGVAADGRMMLNLDRWNAAAAAVMLRYAGVAAGTYRLRTIDVVSGLSTTDRC